jgi:DNA-directed RNA polymerase specialized sigma24 family protein
MSTLIRPLLAQSAIVESIEGTLIRRGIPGEALEDAVAEVQRRAIEAARRGHAPTEIPELRALCNRIARDYAIDETRRQQVRDKYDVGLCEDPDAYMDERGDGRDLVDQRRLLGILRAQIANGEMPEHAEGILVGEAEGVARRVVAAELGITERAVEGRLLAMRRRFRARLVQLAMLEDADAGFLRGCTR